MASALPLPAGIVPMASAARAASASSRAASPLSTSWTIPSPETQITPSYAPRSSEATRSFASSADAVTTSVSSAPLAATIGRQSAQMRAPLRHVDRGLTSGGGGGGGGGVVPGDRAGSASRTCVASSRRPQSLSDLQRARRRWRRRRSVSSARGAWCSVSVEPSASTPATSASATAGATTTGRWLADQSRGGVRARVAVRRGR